MNLKTLQPAVFRFLFLFTLLFIISVPLDYYFIPDPGKYIGSVFEILIKWTGDHILNIQKPYTVEIISDSTGMYIHVFLLLIISFIGSVLWTLLDKQNRKREQLNYWFQVIVSYYLSLQLFRYGFDKLFKHQFYLPEPNTVYTSLGQLSPDILYWSTIGSSYYYSVFCGLLEVIPAILLLFRRTRQLGAIIAMLVMINVVMINFGFDISVKMYSCFLLLLCVVVALPALKKIVALFVLKESVSIDEWKPALTSKRDFTIYILLKTAVIALVLVESLLSYFQIQNFNDDKMARPYLHGAYNIETFIRDSDTIPPLLTDSTRIKRVFIHRQGYFITQNMMDEMNDYELKYDFTNKRLVLTDYDKTQIVFDYRLCPDENLMVLNSNVNGVVIHMQARKIDIEKLPLFQRELHWTIDDY